MSDAFAPDAGSGITTLKRLGGGRPNPAMDQLETRIGDTAEEIGKIGEQRDEALAPLREEQAARAKTGIAEVKDKYGKIEPLDVQPWTAKPPEWNPIEQFGSAASIFAQIASAFTRQPARNALTAGAAVLRAQRSNDLQAYNYAYDGWKENSKLALERHNVMVSDYKQAADLLKTDLAAGSAQLEAIGAKYGDDIAIKLAQEGNYKDLFHVLEARENSARQWAQIEPTLNKEAEHQRYLMTWPDQSPAGRLAAEQKWQEVSSGWALHMTPDQIALRKYLDENPKATAEQIQTFRQGLYRPVPGGTGVGQVRADAIKKKLDEIRAGNETTPGHEPSAAETAAAIKSVYGQGMTGNRVDQLQSHVDMYDDSLADIEKARQTLETHLMSAGLAGRVGRLKERLSNVFGSNETDRVQFMRTIEKLQLMAPNLLLDRPGGRPLGAEDKKINDIIAGLNIGDTTANTLRAFDEIETLYKKKRGDNLLRIKGEWKPNEERVGGATGTQPAATGSAGSSWRDHAVPIE